MCQHGAASGIAEHSDVDGIGECAGTHAVTTCVLVSVLVVWSVLVRSVLVVLGACSSGRHRPGAAIGHEQRPHTEQLSHKERRAHQERARRAIAQHDWPSK